jgi:hypothetical protein
VASFLKAWRALAPRLPSAAFMALGLAALYNASSLPFGTARQPGSGFFPILTCVALVVFAAVSLAAGKSTLPAEDAAQSRGAGAARVWLVVFALAAYAGALVPAGFVLCTAALLLLLLRGIGAASWTVSATLALIGSIGSYWAFVKLGLPLPAGLLGF